MVREEPRNAEDTSRDYKDLDDTAGSTAPDDPRSSGTDSGLTAGGMGTGVEGGGDCAGGSPGNQEGATTGGTSSGSIGGDPWTQVHDVRGIAMTEGTQHRDLDDPDPSSKGASP